VLRCWCGLCGTEASDLVGWIFVWFVRWSGRSCVLGGLISALSWVVFRGRVVGDGCVLLRLCCCQG
jgi:hypothetical protein